MSALSTILSIADVYFKKHPERGLRLILDEDEISFGNPNHQPTVFFKNANATWRKILSNGSMALGELYVKGLWGGTYEDIPYFLEFMLNILEDKSLTTDLPMIEKMIIGVASLVSTTKSGGTTHYGNINSHYSLELALSNVEASNEFFYPILTKDYCVYSCGVWHKGARTLKEAQQSKFDWYANLLNLGRNSRLLDLGCGWGTQSLWYANNLDVNVTMVTLSEAQFKHIDDRISTEGIRDKADVKLMDMMDIDMLGEKFDAVISLGAIEHIEDFDTLFKKTSDVLSVEGKALFHTMFNHVHHDFDKWNSVHMWPGVQIPSRERLLTSLASSFKNVSFTQYPKGSYSKTFRCWLENFVSNEEYLLSILDRANPGQNVHNVNFIRRFKYYLMCCCAVYNVYMDVGFALCDNSRISREE